MSEKDKILIGDSSSKDWVVRRVAKINERLALEVKDNSDS
jgi:hypothetical protein